MPESQMQKIMAAYREWRNSQDAITGSEIPYEPCECPEFGTEMEVE